MREVGMEILSRLEWITLQPEVIVDVGGGLGEMSRGLQTRYVNAKVVTLDLTESMLQQGKQDDKQLSCVCADANALPFCDESVDMLFANLLLPWQTDIESILAEWLRVLRPNGLLMVTAFGPDTLIGWQNRLPRVLDMHDLGDLLLQQKFADPVLDVNYYTLTYREPSKMLHELQATGMLHVGDFVPAPALDGKWEVTYEVIFAHAFKPPASDEVAASSDGVVRVPLAHLRRQLRS